MPAQTISKPKYENLKSTLVFCLLIKYIQSSFHRHIIKKPTLTFPFTFCCFTQSLLIDKAHQGGLDYDKAWYAIEPERQFKAADEVVEAWQSGAAQTSAE